MATARVIVPYTHRDPRVRRAMNALDYKVEWCDVSRSDDAYYWLLHRMWSIGQTFVVVEHDILIRPDTIDQLLACAGHRCSFGYAYLNSDNYHGLGCMKYTAAFIEANPAAMALLGGMHNDTHPHRHWCSLDAFLNYNVLRDQPWCQRHAPPVTHLSDGTPSHGCC